MYFSIRIRTIFAVAGSLAILPECNAEGYQTVFLAGNIRPLKTTGNRQLENNSWGSFCISGRQHLTGSYRGPVRTLTSVEDEEVKDEETQHSLHINATGLPTSCVGCTVAIALIQTSSCSTTDAYDTALKFSLQDALTYVTNENGSTDGWKTTTFRELIDSNNNSTLPLSLVDALNPATSTDSKVAVYLYDMEENPIACATFEEASEEEAAMYEELFYGESESGEGEDDGPDAAAVNPLEDDTSSASGGLELVSAFVTGVSLFASAILVFV
mmetsp:Transcript_19731/g.29224  ORF Transcript_19731/g.29224 Transcript_19731/m.29224 type:complete len:271 (-) Transcript_19731:109-921(-)